MPMNPVVLGAQVILNLEVTDPTVAGLLLAAQLPLCNWTASNMKVDPLGGVPLLAAGAAITGTGGFTYSDPNALTDAIASAIGMSDPIGKSKMSIVTQHYADTIRDMGVVIPASLVAYAGPPPPPTGPVTGQGKVLLNGDFDFATALGIPPGDAADVWVKFGDSLKVHLLAFADVLPGSMMNPAAGGPVTGEGAVA